MKKQIVDVIYRCDKNGNITPLCLNWMDGRSFRIDRVLHISRIPVESYGLRFTVAIGSKQRQIYFCNKRWYVLLKK